MEREQLDLVRARRPAGGGERRGRAGGGRQRAADRRAHAGLAGGAARHCPQRRPRRGPDERAIFWGDLIPTRWQMPVRWTSAFDDYPDRRGRGAQRARGARRGRGLVVLLHPRSRRPADPDRADREGELSAARVIVGYHSDRDTDPARVRIRAVDSLEETPRCSTLLARVRRTCFSPCRPPRAEPGWHAAAPRAPPTAGPGPLSAAEGCDLRRQAQVRRSEPSWRKAGEAFTITFTNKEGQPHNVAVYTADKGGENTVRGRRHHRPRQERTRLLGPSPRRPATYYFQCDDPSRDERSVFVS